MDSHVFLGIVYIFLEMVLFVLGIVLTILGIVPPKLTETQFKEANGPLNVWICIYLCIENMLV